MQNQIYPIVKISGQATQTVAFMVFCIETKFWKGFWLQFYLVLALYNFASWCRPVWRGVFRRKMHMCKFGIYCVLRWSPSNSVTVYQIPLFNHFLQTLTKHTPTFGHVHYTAAVGHLRHGNWKSRAKVQCSPMKLRILGISLVAMVFVGRFSWTLARSKGIFTGYLPMKQSNLWKNRNPTISRTEGACKVRIHESLWQNVCVTPWETCMQGYGGDKIFRNFIDETCTFLLLPLTGLRALIDDTSRFYSTCTLCSVLQFDGQCSMKGDLFIHLF